MAITSTELRKAKKWTMFLESIKEGVTRFGTEDEADKQSLRVIANRKSKNGDYIYTMSAKNSVVEITKTRRSHVQSEESNE